MIHNVFCLSCSNDGSEFGGSIYQKVSDKLETAVNLAWTAGNNTTRFGIAAKYQLDKDASISVSKLTLLLQKSQVSEVGTCLFLFLKYCLQ